MDNWLQLQGLVVAVVLFSAGSSKLLARLSDAAAEQSALAMVVGKERAASAWRAIATCEVLIAVALVSARYSSVPTFAASAFFAAAIGYLIWAWRRVPGASCGCFVGSGEGVGPLAIMRAGSLFAAALVAAFSAHDWMGSLTHAGPPTGALLALELALLVAVSPEIHLFVRRWRTAQPACLTSRVPLEHTVSVIKKSREWRQLRARLRSEELVDFWRDGCWRFHVYGITDDGMASTAVFAVKVPPGRARLKVAVVAANGDLVSTEQSAAPGIEAYA